MTEKDHCLTKLSICLFLSVCLSCLSVTQGATSVCPDFDLDGDCIVDFNDFAIFVTEWLAQRLDCNSGYEDCDDYYYNGCEAHVVTDPNNCGGCDNICSLPHATAECMDGNCVLIGCQGNYDDCDGVPENGCETDLMNDVDNCGFCGNNCNYPNATAACQGGNCIIAACDPAYGDCDGVPENGCETDLMNDANNCGFCGNNCNYPNATAVCQGGSCIIVACDPAYADCDGIGENGCEVNLNNDPACSGAEYLGALEGDGNCSIYTRFLRGEKWYRITLTDDTSNDVLFGSRWLYFQVRLQSPSGVDYNLYMYDDACGSDPIGSSTSYGSIDGLNYQLPDYFGSDESRTFLVEVRYYNGSSCDNWSLQFSGGCPP